MEAASRTGIIVRALGAVGGQTVRDCCFRLFEIRQFHDGFGTELAFLVAPSGQSERHQARTSICAAQGAGGGRPFAAGCRENGKLREKIAEN